MTGNLSLGTLGTPSTYKNIINVNLVDSVKVSSHNHDVTTSGMGAQIGTAGIIDGSITAAKLYDNAVVTRTILNNCISEDKMADRSVSTRTIVAKNVTEPKVADNAIINRCILDNTIKADKLYLGTESGVKNDNGTLIAKVDNKTIQINGSGQLETILNNLIPVGMTMLYPKTDKVITLGGSGAGYVVWILCDGTSYNIADYADLYSVIGTSFGSGTGTFFVPNFVGRTAIGAGLIPGTTDTRSIGYQGGSGTHTLTIPEMPSHTHNILARFDGGGGSGGGDLNEDFYPRDASTQSTGGGSAHNNMQPYLTYNYYIRAK